MSPPTNTMKRFNEVVCNYRDGESENVVQHVKKAFLLRDDLKAQFKATGLNKTLF